MDMTHGGDILAEEYTKRGYHVVCADVYNIATEEQMDHIRSLGAEAYPLVPEGYYDLKIAPAHCPDIFADGSRWDKEMTFSEAVNQCIDDDRFRIEITGVKGKTSSCYILAAMLDAAGKKVFLHTSRGQGPFINGHHRIECKMSIAPTSLLRLPKGDYDVIIAECSLGGSGKADVAVITNLVEDYGIAKNTRRASDAKASILTDKVNIVLDVEKEMWSRYGSHELIGYGGRIKILKKPRFGEVLEVSVDYDGISEISLDGSYLSIGYIDSMDLALEVCKSMNISKEAVLKALSDFKGVPGRGEIIHDNGLTVIRERNPGISHISIRRTLDCLNILDQLNERTLIILDPVSKKVCDKMDIDQIRSVVESFGVDMIVTAGDGVRPDIPNGKTEIIEFIKEGFQ